MDIAPTLLTFAGAPTSDWPAFLDGRDLSSEWTTHQQQWSSWKSSDSTEVINIEFWGAAVPEGAIQFPKEATNNTYKTVRIIGADYGYLFSYWCTNEVEIYDTVVSLSPFRRK